MNGSQRISRRAFTHLGVSFLGSITARPLVGAPLIQALPPSPNLPEALLFDSGGKVASRADWLRRRQQILRTAAQQMYGTAPPSAPTGFEVQEKRGTAFGGKATRTQIRLHFKPGTDASGANLLLYVPTGFKRPPVILGLNFWGNHTLSDDPGVMLSTSWVESGTNPFTDLNCVKDHHATNACRGMDARRWPVEKLLAHGYALCTVSRGDIDADLPDGTVPGLRASFPELQDRDDNFSAIGAWAWTLSRMLDYLETDDSVDAKRVAVFGWSRLGKAAVWAGANDQRFAAVLSHESGAGGAKLFRRGVGEDIHRLNTVFPHWFCRNFRRYNSMDRQLPFDQHLLLSCIAPRPLFIASAVDDVQSDPPGEFASGVLASSVYRFLGSPGLPSTTMPPPGQPLSGNVSYQIRRGGHDVTDYDWDQYLTFLDRFVTDAK